MAETYTYTARNADNPEEVVTFTLQEDYLYVNLTGVFEQIDNVRKSEERGKEIRRQVRTVAKPMFFKLIESFTGPVHISDINTGLIGERLVLNAWKRLAGFRLTPMLLSISRVDNPEAAEAFVNELSQRKMTAGRVGKFFGPLDYWFGWIGLFLLIGVLIRWPHREE